MRFRTKTHWCGHAKTKRQRQRAMAKIFASFSIWRKWIPLKTHLLGRVLNILTHRNEVERLALTCRIRCNPRLLKCRTSRDRSSNLTLRKRMLWLVLWATIKVNVIPRSKTQFSIKSLTEEVTLWQCFQNNWRPPELRRLLDHYILPVTPTLAISLRQTSSSAFCRVDKSLKWQKNVCLHAQFAACFWNTVGLSLLKREFKASNCFAFIKRFSHIEKFRRPCPKSPYNAIQTLEY